jgi:predicted nucleotidyltransferase
MSQTCATTDADAIVAALREALPELRATWPIRSLALFGSRVRGDATPASDLDVLIEFERPVALSSFLALEARLGELSGIRVDLVSAAALKPHIGARVRGEALAL